ncbi:hypothetical protein JHK85_007234 [Glycine max]|nr:hypothetical protein JHK85_007234 [Glycine max]
MQSQKVAINTMIEEAILDVDRKGIKVLSLGLRNQGEDLNINGGLYVSRHPKLKVRVVDGSSLVVAVRRENMVGVLPKRRILMRHGESQGNHDTTMYTTIPDHNIQSTAQGMTQALRAEKHLRRVISSYGCSPD